MQNKAHALAAGLFVVVVAALLVLMAMWLLRDSANTQRYEMVSATPVSGLQEQAAVRYKGVEVGKVTAIGFDPAQRSNVLVTLAIDEDAPISGSTYATLALQGITGLSFVQLNDKGPPSGMPEIGPNGVPRLPLQESALRQISDRASDFMTKAEQVVDAINAVLSADNQEAISQALTGLNSTMEHFNQLALTADEVLVKQFGSERMDLPGLVEQTTQTLKTLSGATQDVRHAVAQIDALVADARASLNRVTNDGGIIDQLDEGARLVMNTTLPRIQTLTRDASSTIQRLDRLADALGENPQLLLYGHGSIAPGPGERGFEPPVPGGASERPEMP